MKNRIFIISLCFVFAIICVFFCHNDKVCKVDDVITPTKIILEGKELKLDDFDCFDTKFTPKNTKLAQKFNISEEEAFILGNLGKYWASGLLNGRYVYFSGDDLIFLRTSYTEKFKYSGFCIKNEELCYKDKFEKRVNDIRNTKYAAYRYR